MNAMRILLPAGLLSLAVASACGGDDTSQPGAQPTNDAAAPASDAAGSDATLDGGAPDAPADSAGDAAITRHGPAMGTNLSGMEWAAPGLRYGLSTLPNVNFTVPRKADVAYLAANGYVKNRLPIQWELLQPMLNDTVANAAAKAAIGNPGELDATYASFITDVLDAHAAAGIKAIIDCHNYCRYQDFVYQADGSVSGLVVPPNPLLRPYTSDASQVQVRICALAPGATLTQANLVDFWTRVAKKWKDHPGFGGYGLMNEPNQMPAPGGTVSSSGNEDLTIWPTFAQAAIDAIRAVDPSNPIYVSGNEWSSAMSLATKNPGFPLKGTNLIYEIHMYLDASSAGYAFDYDTEVAKGYSAGLGNVPIDANTGVNRLKLATDWASANGAKLALTEIGMPIDDPRWATMFTNAIDFAEQQGLEVYTWMGGSHWATRNYAMNQAPGWHQNKTLEPAVSGPLKAASGVALATLYDDGPGYVAPGSAVTITVYARGNLASPVHLTVTSSNGGALSKTQLTIPAGANGQDTYTFAPNANDMATLTYASDAPGGRVPPPRTVYAFTDPVQYASTSVKDAAMAILAKYGAAKWDMADGYTDYEQGAPAAPGQIVRAVSDSGYGSSAGNAMEMLDWMNDDNAAVRPVLPIMRDNGGNKYADVRAAGTSGFWCKKTSPVAAVEPNPLNRMLYNLEDSHFAIAVVSVPTASNSGVVFEASKAEDVYYADLRFASGQPQARWVDAAGTTAELTSPTALAAGAPAVLTMTSTAGAQSLRVNAVEVGHGTATFSASALNQMLIGWGFVSYYPRDGFGGDVYAVATGKGTPSANELQVIERYLAGKAGLTL